MATHSNTLAWKIPWTEKPSRLQSMGSLGVRHDGATSLSLSCIGEGNGNQFQCSFLENPRHGGVWRAAIYGVAQSRTQLKRFSSSSSSSSPTFPAPLVEEIVFSSLYILACFVKDKVSIGVWIYLWAFYFVPLIYIYVFVPVPYYLDDCGFVGINRQVDSSSSILLSQDCFDYSRFSVFPYKL